MRTMAALVAIGMVSAMFADEPKRNAPPPLVDMSKEIVRVYAVDALPAAANGHGPGNAVQQLMRALAGEIQSNGEKDPEGVTYLEAARSIAVYTTPERHVKVAALVESCVQSATLRTRLGKLAVEYRQACNDRDAAKAREIAGRMLELDPFAFGGSFPVERKALEAPPVLPVAFQPDVTPKDLAADPQFNLLKAEFEKTWKVSGPLEKK